MAEKKTYTCIYCKKECTIERPDAKRIIMNCSHCGRREATEALVKILEEQNKQ